MNRALTKPYVAPLSPSESVVNIEWYASPGIHDVREYLLV